MDESTMRKRAKSRVFLSMKTPKEISKERKDILRRYRMAGWTHREPYNEGELDERYLLIQALKDRGDLRCGFDIHRTEDGSYRLTETFGTTRRGSHRR